jgi:hypothetical protein
MNLLRSRYLRAAVLALFVGFQAAQALHSHSGTDISEQSCATCQAVHQASTEGSSARTDFAAVVVFEPVSADHRRFAAVTTPVECVLPRAPPAL